MGIIKNNYKKMDTKTLALIATVLLAATTLDSASNNKFAEFKSTHGKTY